MTERDPFAVLGLSSGATLADVRAARRRLAKEAHPDHGGDEARMREINTAFDAAIKAVLRPGASLPPTTRPPSPAPRSRPSRPPPAGPRAPRSRRIRVVEQDVASFVIQALRPEAFEALVLATHWLGEPIDDDPPHWLEAHLYEPAECWCRLELMPEAGATMVALTIAHVEGTPWPPPGIDDVRDAWIEALSALGE